MFSLKYSVKTFSYYNVRRSTDFFFDISNLGLPLKPLYKNVQNVFQVNNTSLRPTYLTIFLVYY